MVFVGETSKYHSRGKEYIVLFWRDLWVLQQTGEVWCLSGGGMCQLLTDNLLRVIYYKSALCLPIFSMHVTYWDTCKHEPHCGDLSAVGLTVHQHFLQETVLHRYITSRMNGKMPIKTCLFTLLRTLRDPLLDSSF